MRFKVEGNPIAEQINALLPQTQCGQCGYPGCKPYAEAIAGGDKINKCPPGGESTIQALADLLDVEAEPLDAVEGEKAADGRLYSRSRMHWLHQVHPGLPGGCHRRRGQADAHRDLSECTGCDLCVEPCPVDCIDMLEVGSSVQSWKWEKPLAPGQLDCE